MNSFRDQAAGRLPARFEQLGEDLCKTANPLQKPLMLRRASIVDQKARIFTCHASWPL
jgi:hypothetical protein